MAQFSYVASGCSYFRLNYEEAYTGELNVFINKCLKSLQGVGDHKFSLLYNAHTEKKFGPMLQDAFRDSINDVYADSGGLQIVTLGHTITPELKRTVYENQAKYSDIAMSFDEIPVKASRGGRVEKKDSKNRFFDRENLEERAKATGINLREQIEYFDKKKSDAKPIFICHGNDYDTFMRWADIGLKQIPKSLRSRIGGVALSGASIGTGTLEDVKRAFFATQLIGLIEAKHVHSLGIGSVQRLIPALMFARNGLYSDDVQISYDSTSHTSGPHIGRYYGTFGWTDFPKSLSPMHDIMYDEIQAHIPFFTRTKDEFFEGLNSPARGYQEKHGSLDAVLESFIAFITTEIMIFQKHVAEIVKKPLKMERWVTPIQMSAFLELEKVKNSTDFRRWEQQAGKYLKSTKVAPNAPVSLEDLFV